MWPNVRQAWPKSGQTRSRPLPFQVDAWPISARIKPVLVDIVSPCSPMFGLGRFRGRARPESGKNLPMPAEGGLMSTLCRDRPGQLPTSNFCSMQRMVPRGGRVSKSDLVGPMPSVTRPPCHNEVPHFRGAVGSISKREEQVIR